MKALIIGATGATGKDLVQILLADPDYTAVTIFVRRPSGLAHPKLSEVITDFNNLENLSVQINGDVWFSCLGTTLKAAGSKEKQWHIDHDIPLKFAEIARRNDIPTAVLLSAYGASASSKVFYSKMKGQLEDAINALAFNRLIIFRPGLLLRANTDRMGERIMAGMLKLMNTIGLFRKFRGIPTALLAAKLAKAPKVSVAGKQVVELEKIFGF